MLNQSVWHAHILAKKILEWFTKGVRGAIRLITTLKFQMKGGFFWYITVKINENFAYNYLHVQKPLNNCFESKQPNTILHQPKICKHKCDKIAAKYKIQENSEI